MWLLLLGHRQHITGVGFLIVSNMGRSCSGRSCYFQYLKTIQAHPTFQRVLFNHLISYSSLGTSPHSAICYSDFEASRITYAFILKTGISQVSFPKRKTTFNFLKNRYLPKEITALGYNTIIPGNQKKDKIFNIISY